jgi:hypothetical protein
VILVRTVYSELGCAYMVKITAQLSDLTDILSTFTVVKGYSSSQYFQIVIFDIFIYLLPFTHHNQGPEVTTSTAF